MARKKGKPNPDQTVMDYRHEDAKRKNIPPAGLAAQGKIREKPKIQYAYNPHLPPILRFDKTGKTDGLPELLETARTRPLNMEEAELLAEALRKQEPWLEWAGKQEKKGFDVDPVAITSMSGSPPRPFSRSLQGRTFNEICLLTPNWNTRRPSSFISTTWTGRTV